MFIVVTPQLVEVNWHSKIMMIAHNTASIITHYHLSIWWPYFQIAHWASLKHLYFATLIYTILGIASSRELWPFRCPHWHAFPLNPYPPPTHAAIEKTVKSSLLIRVHTAAVVLYLYRVALVLLISVCPHFSHVPFGEWIRIYELCKWPHVARWEETQCTSVERMILFDE